MANFWRSAHWFYRGLFLTIAFLLLFVRLLPLGQSAGALPGPDLLLCFIMAWVVRRPDYVTLLMIVIVLLMEDLLLMRPPGLWTALVVLATEFLRSRMALTRELNFIVEWILVSALMLGLLLAYRLIFAMAFLQQPPFGFAVVQMLWSILLYPIVVGLSALVLNLRKPATGEIDSFGRKV